LSAEVATAGYSGTHLAPKLGLKKLLLLHFMVAVTVMTWVGQSSAEDFAGSIAHLFVKSGNDSDMTLAARLKGCWVEAPSQRDLDLAPSGYIHDAEACFDGGQGVRSSVFGGGEKFAEGFDAVGHYSVREGKLFLRGPLWEGWIFERVRMVCYPSIDASGDLHLRDCVGSGGDGEDAKAPPARIEDRRYLAVKEKL
jgi:hypothetical protein